MNFSLAKNLYNRIERSVSLQLLLVIFLAIIIQLFLFGIGFYAISGDESDRSIQAFNWAMGFPIFDAAWLPLHKIILGLGFKIFPDLFLTPRLINSIFGILLIPLAAWLAHELFSSKKIVITSAILSCFFFPRIIFTAVPLTESIFITLIIAAFSLYIRWLNGRSSIFLFASSIWFMLGCTIRYEGWLLSASFGILILYHFISRNPKISFKYFFLILVILSAFPIYWLYYHYLESGSALGFLFSTTERYSFIHGSSFFNQIKNSLVPQFIFQNIVSINLLGLIAAVVLWSKSKTIKLFLILFLISFMIMTLATVLGKALPSHNFWRVPAVWSFLLIPFTSYFIINYNSFISKTKYPLSQIMVVIFIIFNLLMTGYEVNKRSSFTEEQLAVGNFLSNLLKNNSSSNVLVETSSWGYLNILVSSQHPNNFIFNTGKDPRIPSSSILTENFHIDQLKEINISFFLFKSEYNKSILAKSSAVNKLANFGKWELYKSGF